MLLIKLIDARRGLHNKCVELFSDQKIAEEIYRKLCNGIEDCETVEAESKRGRWVFTEYESGHAEYCCSECGEGVYNKSNFYFCPNCGAKMEGGEE